MILSAIAAVTDNGVIGRDGGLPWHLPADLRYFKHLTWGHVVIMGRKTFESVGKPLPGRETIVVSRLPDYQVPEGVLRARSVEDAIEIARAKNQEEVFVAGGGEIYARAWSFLDRLYITRIHAVVEGDTFFPEFEADDWRLVQEDAREPDDRHAFAFTFQVFSRKRERAESPRLESSKG